MFIVILIIGLFCSFGGAVMAFLISYAEYTHHYTDKRKPLWLSMQTALFTFAFFLILAVIIGLFVNLIT